MSGLRVGVALGRLNPAYHLEVTLEAERLGYESVWLPEHLVFPASMSGSPHPGEESAGVPPTTPVFDVFAYLAFLAARTSRIRFGTHVYNLALRHPFVAARAVTTVDVLSGGRLELGVGAGWLREEWAAAQLDFGSRGRRLDEALEVCRRLWTEPEISHRGEFFEFGPVAFEPKPVQSPHPPVLVGGESTAALRRAARAGDGWIGMHHTPESVRPQVEALDALRDEHGTGAEPFTVTVGAPTLDVESIAAFSDAGVDRVVVSPWQRSREAVDGLRALAPQLP